METLAIEHLMADPMGPVELSRRLDVTSAAATVMVRRLEEAGHLERRPHPDDRRRIVLVPTPNARRQVIDHVRPMVEGFDAAAHTLDAQERAVVARYLADVAAVLRTVTGETPPR